MILSSATSDVDEPTLVAQHDPLVSPLVWDLAHVGQQEELWLLRGGDQASPGMLPPDVDALYDAFKHPPAERPSLPPVVLIPRSSLISGRIGEPSHSQPNPWKELSQLAPAGEQIAQFGGKKAVQIQQPIAEITAEVCASPQARADYAACSQASHRRDPADSGRERQP